MSSISKLTSNLFSGSQQLVATLAQLNFDFSLVKLEAPAEFSALGASLTSARREIAEAGRVHVTARKLGALFDDVFPRTPRLVEAYGIRVSEIASSAIANPPATAGDSIFADYAGADGTSIWAAATSGSSAIPVHLLGCMLARMWSASEATSIWAEIVDTRKKELIGSITDNDPLKLSSLLAAQIAIERSQLAEWDNSARAWLRRADEVKSKKQTQLMLILNNLSLAVSPKSSTYQSVISALRTALSAMEELLCGRPQSVADGSVLLGLSCWHIYPDLIVLGHRTVSQEDNLVPQDGKLTLGLDTSSARKNDGLYWCMSLAHMRHYGPPVHAERRLAAGPSRLSVDHLVQVALGSLIRAWGYRVIEAFDVCQIIVAIYDGFLKESKRNSNIPLSSRKLTKSKSTQRSSATRLTTEPNWIQTISKAAAQFIRVSREGEEIERRLYSRLIALGYGPGSSFVNSEAQSTPFFGLLEMHEIIPLLNNDEDRLAVLRIYAARFFPNAKPWEVIIRYRVDNKDRIYKAPDSEQLVSDTGKTEVSGVSEPGVALSEGETSIKNDTNTKQSGTETFATSCENQKTDETHTASDTMSESNSLFSWQDLPRSDDDTDILKVEYRGTVHDIYFRGGSIEDGTVSIGDVRDTICASLGTSQAWRLGLKLKNEPLYIRNKSCKSAGITNETVLSAQCDQFHVPHTKSETTVPTPEIVLTSEISDTKSEQHSTSSDSTSYLTIFEYSTAVPVYMKGSTKDSKEELRYYRWNNTCFKPEPTCLRNNFSTSHISEINSPQTSEMLKNGTTRTDLVDLSNMEFSGPNDFVEPFRKPFNLESVDHFPVPHPPKLATDHSNSSISTLKENSAVENLSAENHIYEFFMGDPESAAVYITSELQETYQHESDQPFWYSKQVRKKKRVDRDVLKTALTSGSLSTESLDFFLRDGGHQVQCDSFRALAFIEDLYGSLPHSTIDSDVTMRPIWSSKWLKDHFKGVPGYFLPKFTREQAFACVAMLETGSVDVPASTFQNVFALSAGDSLYVAAPLLSDPTEISPPHGIRHVIGNIGRPGLSLLVPPNSPQVLPSGTKNWNQIDRMPYDGEARDSFGNTSLHLRLSDWTQAIDIGRTSQDRRDTEASLVEAFVQVNSSGKWIADLDILANFNRGYHQFDHKYYFRRECPHSQVTDPERDREHLCANPMTSIDSWDEFLSRPDGPAVVRAHNNWLARVATCVLGIDRGDRVVVGDRVCWDCYRELEESGGPQVTDKILFVT